MSGRRVWLFWAGGVLAVAVLALLGALVGWGVVRLLSDPDATFADLGAIVAGMALGVLAASAGWLVIVALLVARNVAAGRRLRVGAACVGAVAAAALAGFGALALVGRLEGYSGAAVSLVVLTALVAPPILARRAAR